MLLSIDAIKRNNCKLCAAACNLIMCNWTIPIMYARCERRGLLQKQRWHRTRIYEYRMKRIRECERNNGSNKHTVFFNNRPLFARYNLSTIGQNPRSLASSQSLAAKPGPKFLSAITIITSFTAHYRIVAGVYSRIKFCPFAARHDNATPCIIAM